MSAAFVLTKAKLAAQIEASITAVRERAEAAEAGLWVVRTQRDEAIALLRRSPGQSAAGNRSPYDSGRNWFVEVDAFLARVQQEGEAG